MFKIKDRRMFFLWVWIWCFVAWEIALIVLFSLGFAKDFGIWLYRPLTRLPWGIAFYPVLFIVVFGVVVKFFIHLCDWFGKPRKT